MPKRRFLHALCLAAAALACAVLFFSAAQPAPVRPAPQNAARSMPAGGRKNDQTLLFPGLDRNAITAITLASPDTRFEFLCSAPNGVSVNGSQADSEIFLTLIEQIAEMTASPAEAVPEGSELLLSLTIFSGASEHQAAFYSGGKDGSRAFVRTGAPDAPKYHQTAGWRIGTLMLTCEGTRIQDAQGRELPAP